MSGNGVPTTGMEITRARRLTDRRGSTSREARRPAFCAAGPGSTRHAACARRAATTPTRRSALTSSAFAAPEFSKLGERSEAKAGRSRRRERSEPAATTGPQRRRVPGCGGGPLPHPSVLPAPGSVLAPPSLRPGQQKPPIDKSYGKPASMHSPSVRRPFRGPRDTDPAGRPAPLAGLTGHSPRRDLYRKHDRCISPCGHPWRGVGVSSVNRRNSPRRRGEVAVIWRVVEVGKSGLQSR